MPIGGINDLLNNTQTSKVGQKPSSEMGKDQFLQLMVGQLKTQDPMNPMEDKDFMGQMAQFSQLEQMTNVASTLQNDRAFGLIGRTVAYNDKDTGEVKAGTVEKVVINAGKPTLTINGVSQIDPAAVTEVS